MEALTESRIAWCAGLLVSVFVIRFALRRFGPRPMEVIEIQIEAVDDLKLRETVRGVVANLGLRRAISLRNVKTGQEFMKVWLYVTHADVAVPEVERALSAYPVRVRALGPPIDLSGRAMMRRVVPAVWRGLVASWHETRR